MGVDAVMDKDVYQSASKKNGDYVSSINPAGESDSEDEVAVPRGARYTIPLSVFFAVPAIDVFCIMTTSATQRLNRKVP